MFPLPRVNSANNVYQYDINRIGKVFFIYDELVSNREENLSFLKENQSKRIAFIV